MVEMSGELDATTFESYRGKALELIGKDMEVDGFRKGKVPANIVAQKLPESAVLQEMAELAMSDAYPKILEENKIDAIGRPEIGITKIAKENPLGFKITTAVMPEVKLADYKKIAKGNPEVKATEVTDKEVDDAIMEVKRMRAHQDFHKHDEPGAEHKEHAPIEDKDLPELTDEYVQGFGDFPTVTDFKNKMKENIAMEKAQEAKSKSRLVIIEQLVKDSTVEIPQVILQAEIDKTIYKIQTDIEQAGMNFEDYMKQIGKTREDLAKEFAPDAEKRAKLELILHAIGEKEKLVPNEAEVAEQVKHLLDHYKGADPIRARAYIENIMKNELVFKFLEEIR